MKKALIALLILHDARWVLRPRPWLDGTPEWWVPGNFPEGATRRLHNLHLESWLGTVPRLIISPASQLLQIIVTIRCAQHLQSGLTKLLWAQVEWTPTGAMSRRIRI